MKNKTATEWLEIARKDGADWVDKAIQNIEAQPNFNMREKNYAHLSEVIMNEFFWDDTPE